MARTKLVTISAHVPKWVKHAFERRAREQRRTVSSFVGEILIEDCADDPENPANQPQNPQPWVIDTPVAQEAAPRPCHVQPDVSEMPNAED
jgi:hypothetical protein